MTLSAGFSLMRTTAQVLAEYESQDFARANRERLDQLHAAMRSVNPVAYRGISRDPLQAYPSLDLDEIEALRGSGLEMDRDERARWRFRELIGPANEDDLYESDLLPTAELAHELHALLDRPSEYEVVALSRDPTIRVANALGFDIGYWGGDHFSLICDVAIMPRWHAPPPEEFENVAARLRQLNDHVLFPNREAATQFLAYYCGQAWAETECEPGEFVIIEVGSELGRAV